MTTKTCDHDIAWDVTDGLDGMCRKCLLYVMKPECVTETAKWFEQMSPAESAELRAAATHWQPLPNAPSPPSDAKDKAETTKEPT